MIITIKSPSSNQEKTVTITRVQEKHSFVSSHMRENIFYVKIDVFNDYIGDEIRNHLHKNLLQGKNIQGIILDLRSNPGGSMAAALDVASYFLDSGVFYRYKARGVNLRQVNIKDNVAKAPKVPLVVLINENSASASEAFAVAIKDYERGIIMGIKSYGKGVGQERMHYSDGSSIVLTTLEFFSPKGHKVHNLGVEPDMVVLQEQVKDDKHKDDKHVSDSKEKFDMYKSDVQYAKAVDYLIENIKLGRSTDIIKK